MEGIIKTLISDKGFGFITVDGEEKDLFFHRNELQGVEFEELKAGDRVSFEKTDSEKGPNATSVKRA
jgi:cold shock protein